MKQTEQKPDTERVLKSLKDFQRRTVDYVFRRLYLDEDHARRFLVADEVGLGKTLVARGLIAKAIDHLWDKVPRIDVVYICSNSEIARQNIARLHIAEEREFTPPSRLTLLPLHVHGIKDKRRLNFVAFTPGTSFELTGGGGRYDERCLLYHVLSKPWEFRGKAPYNVMSLSMGTDNFIRHCDWVKNAPIDEEIITAFLRDLDERDQADKRAGHKTLRQRFDILCEHFCRSDARVTGEVDGERYAVVGELRRMLARTSLHWLQPDLIIMDEFQRFKHLLDHHDEAGELAQHLFNYADEKSGSSARVVLLSATPYKMFTMHEEAEGDNHYGDFLDTLRFLFHQDGRTGDMEKLLEDYSRELHRMPSEGHARLLTMKSQLESVMRKVMVRTERLAGSKDRNGMLKEVTATAHVPAASDIRHYLGHARVARELESGSMIEYWKSAPYLLNFMEHYQFKKTFEARTGRDTDASMRQALLDAEGSTIPHSTLKRYRKIDPANSRLRGLLHDTVGTGLWKLLWMPPSLPYYELADEYAQPGIAASTKRLVFSCWHVVPKVIAAMVSYEAERNCILLHDPKAWNTPAARKKRPQLLRFSKSDGRLTGMPVVGLVYPSVALAEATDPLRIAATLKSTTASRETLSATFANAKSAVQTLLNELCVKTSTGGAADEDWYWLAPLLMDLTRYPKETLGWLGQKDLSAQWSGEGAPEADRENHWQEHVRTLNERASEFLRGQLKLGPQPDDLADVLAWTGLAGLGVCAYRALRRMEFADEGNLHRNRAGQVAYAFLTLFNLPESMYLIRGSRGGEESRTPYWIQVMHYAAGGCLQAVLDEYVHILRESLGRVDDTADNTLGDIADAICGVLRLRTSRVGYDHITAKPRRNIVLTPSGMRVRFALRFGREKADDAGGEETREDQVRAAFNSPFWPFVLATTSIGQEGLDFHQYCHAIVHWNLPTNPVDLEQREGRIHRYKGHAIRKNVAKRYGLPVSSAHADPWAELFKRAVNDCAASGSEIEPFWVFPVQNGAAIERHVPVLPTSADEQRLTFLRRAVSLYRLVFGQLRQEDMMRFLMERLPAAEAEQLAAQLPLNLEPPR